MRIVPTRLRTGLLLAACLVALLVVACEEDNQVVCISCPADYKPATSPENIIYNLQRSYQYREINQYAKLLAPEFRFNFQPQDVVDLGPIELDRSEDSTGTDALFTTTEVADIRIELIYGAAVPADDVDLPADAMKIRANQVQLQVDETSGISWVATDVQDFFLRPGRPANGENAANWYLLEWRDIPTTATPGSQATKKTTWGKIKVMYTS